MTLDKLPVQFPVAEKSAASEETILAVPVVFEHDSKLAEGTGPGDRGGGGD